MNGVNRIEFPLQQFGSKNAYTSLDKKSPAPNPVVLSGSKEEVENYSLKLNDTDKDRLFKEIEKLNETLKDVGTKMHYKYIEDADKFVVELIDLKTQEVIESLPPEYMIDLSIKIREMVGLFIDKKV
jgi:flagellar protein FlaG